MTRKMLHESGVSDEEGLVGFVLLGEKNFASRLELMN